jgi:hypothetical protein
MASNMAKILKIRAEKHSKIRVEMKKLDYL